MATPTLVNHMHTPNTGAPGTTAAATRELAEPAQHPRGSDRPEEISGPEAADREIAQAAARLVLAEVSAVS